MNNKNNILEEFWGIENIEEDILEIEDLKDGSIYYMEMFGVSGCTYFKYLDNTDYVELLNWDSKKEIFNFKDKMSKKELFQLINSIFTPHIYETYIDDVSYYIYYYGHRVGIYNSDDEYFTILDDISNKY